MSKIISLVCGIIFGIGLTVSQMINPAKVLWLQLGIRSVEAKELVESKNMEYIENRCTKMEYQKIFLNINPAFPVLQN